MSLSKHITDKMPTGIITVDLEGRITGHNPASERIFGGTLNVHSMLPDLVRESRALRDLLDRCIRNGETFTRIQFSAPMTQDTDKRIGINLSPITDSSGRIEGAICLLSDLTEIVELQNQIKLKENLAALGEISAGIAHEFKNSIATILGYAQMSRVETDMDALHSYAAEIQKESQALSTMITEFLNFARPVSAAFYDADIVSLLEAVIEDVRKLRPGDYDIRFEASIRPTVDFDATLLRQSFLNLLINATEALDGRGVISVTVDSPRPRNIVRVVIEDNGRGIPQAQISKIFFPFFTTKPHGTGLGLALVQKFIIAHNGKIEVQSAEGKGTRFTVTLPRN